MNIIEGNLLVGKGTKICIISARFNDFFTKSLVEGAKDAFIRHGGLEANIDVILVPGAFELSIALQKAFKTIKYQGACCLGAVIRGDTPHFDYVCAETTKGIASVSLKYNKPASFGLLTTDSMEQTMARSGSKAGNKGAEAMHTLIEMINLSEGLK